MYKLIHNPTISQSFNGISFESTFKIFYRPKYNTEKYYENKWGQEDKIKNMLFLKGIKLYSHKGFIEEIEISTETFNLIKPYFDLNMYSEFGKILNWF
jgi:hypothetical protein